MTTKIIAELNDKFRNLGRYRMTPGVQSLAKEKQFELIQLVRDFDCFTTGNDPYGEHDFGKVTMDGEDYFWKIDCYDLDLKHLSNNPADSNLTKRVLTIMQSSEY